jgi:hypothetical protein
VTQFLVAALELRIKSLPSASQREVRIRTGLINI